MNIRKILILAAVLLGMLAAASCEKEEPYEFVFPDDTDTVVPDPPEPPAQVEPYVDLGLSVKWGSWNLGATKPAEFGTYFAWGEVEPKEIYADSTYRFFNGTEGSINKYSTSRRYGMADYKTILDPADDAAHAMLDSSWRMPTQEEMQELMERCTWSWTEQDSVAGYVVTGPNGNSIFLPAAGYRDGDQLKEDGMAGLYYTSSLFAEYPSYAYYLNFTRTSRTTEGILRNKGLAIRPVLP